MPRPVLSWNRVGSWWKSIRLPANCLIFLRMKLSPWNIWPGAPVPLRLFLTCVLLRAGRLLSCRAVPCRVFPTAFNNRINRFAQALIGLGCGKGQRMTILAVSPVYETPPWGVTDQPAFLNQVVMGFTTVSPHRLLDKLKRIEKQMGRQETIRFGPRLIDLDILLYGQRILQTHRLQIPHPRMLERAFVLVPLVEISPQITIPGTGKTAADYLALIDTTGINRVEPGDILPEEPS